MRAHKKGNAKLYVLALHNELFFRKLGDETAANWFKCLLVCVQLTQIAVAQNGGEHILMILRCLRCSVGEKWVVEYKV